ncbi:hypothetical protein [Stenotrophomonas indicatrix]|uniref:hypothetical protein n=1 Tax=Stenotrophomonas indicatrix TaxID=2045451 RepID=UPI001CBD5B63|nr:hypothetical protein [Stenotrophomonas indicatrix]
MGDAYEVVMEDVPHDCVLMVVSELHGLAGSVFPLEIDGIVVDLHAWSHSALRSEERQRNFCLIQRLGDFSLSGSARLKVLLLRVIGFNGAIDVEVSFDAEPSDVQMLMQEFQTLFFCLKRCSGAGAICGGMEPVADSATRIFMHG